MSAITAKASRKMKKYAVLTREPRCFLGSFDFSWEQRKFDEVFDCTVPNNTLSRAELSYDEGTVLNVHYGDVLIKYGSVLDVQKDDIPRIPHRCREDFNGALLQDGDVIIADTAEDETTGKACEIGNLQGSAIVSGLHTMVCRPRNRMALGYLGYYLNSNAYHHQLLPLMQGIKVLSLSRSNIQKTSVSYPIAVKEQQLIAYYFSQLDNLITLHQRKCANLCSPSKVVFSLLFATSTFSWEQRKLGDIADIVGGGTPSTGNQSYWDGDIDWYAPAEIADQIYANSSQKKITGLGYENSSAKMLPPGTVLFTSRAGIGKTAILTRKGCTNQGFQSIVPHRGELDSYFIFSRTGELKRYGELVGAGSTFVEVSGKQMAVMELMMPPTMREQQTIGGFFQQLDHLITLHQRECISFTGRADRLILTANRKRTTSSWEQRKLGDVVKEIIRNDPESEAPIMMITANNGFIEQSERYAFNNAGESLKKYILLKKGELAYNHGASKLRPYGSCFALTTAENARIPFVYHCFSAENQNAEFMSIELNGAEIENQLRKIVSSGARMDGLLNISFDEYTSVSVLLPGTEEQDRIADFFRHLDNLITLHQRKPFLMKWRTSDANRNQTNRLVL